MVIDLKMFRTIVSLGSLLSLARGLVAPALVVTGGPCSGKTTLLAATRTLGGGRARVVAVPEAATLYHERGGRLPFGCAAVDASGAYDARARCLLWEAWLVTLKLSLEDAARDDAAALARAGAAAAVVCDRGVVDSAAYLADDAEWDELLALGGWDERSLLARYIQPERPRSRRRRRRRRSPCARRSFGLRHPFPPDSNPRYDGVVHLAVAPRAAYELDGNGARTEDHANAVHCR